MSCLRFCRRLRDRSESGSIESVFRTLRPPERLFERPLKANQPMRPQLLAAVLLAAFFCMFSVEETIAKSSDRPKRSSIKCFKHALLTPENVNIDDHGVKGTCKSGKCAIYYLNMTTYQQEHRLCAENLQDPMQKSHCQNDTLYVVGSITFGCCSEDYCNLNWNTTLESRERMKTTPPPTTTSTMTSVTPETENSSPSLFSVLSLVVFVPVVFFH